MKQIVILSGKGGTGKTVLSASFALLSKNTIVADCDVDAPNLHLILRPDVRERGVFSSAKLAVIDGSKCTNCGRCTELCRFGAVKLLGSSSVKITTIDSERCEGCGVCVRICPAQAVKLIPRPSGEWFVSNTRGGKMAHALLDPGGENSGMLVSLVKQKAHELADANGASAIIVDGPPGIGCPAIASLSGADVAVVVAEPSKSCLSDFERVVALCQHFDIPVACIVNRYDINDAVSKEIEAKAMQMGVRMLGLIPYDECVVRKMAQGLAPVEGGDDSPVRSAIEVCLRKLTELVDRSGFRGNVDSTDHD